RDEEKLYVSAPYAITVHEGKNVTANPPRTEIWALLYAQVKQADGKDFRNVLLAEKQLDWRIQVDHPKKVKPARRYTIEQEKTMKYLKVKNLGTATSDAVLKVNFDLKDYTLINKDATKYGTAIWSN